ncbi:hypothetical protein ACFQ2M_27830 [Kitasatospora saccharophila]|uniref:hypothetical protein n=1 Tax=Kitasatospora saccharophila TaxID=407973 RepID=UPI003644A268
MNAPLPERTVRDLTGMLVQAAHAMNTRLSLALAEIDSSPRKHCVLLHALEAERTQSRWPRSPGWTRPPWWSPPTNWSGTAWPSATPPRPTGG